MMLAGMLASQIITVAIVLLIPPQPAPSVSAGTIAAALSGSPQAAAGTKGLSIVTAPGPPSPPVDVAHRDPLNELRLAALTHKPVQDVRFFFIHDPHWLESMTDVWRPAPNHEGRHGLPPFPHHRPGDAAQQQTPRRWDTPPPWLVDPAFLVFGNFVAATRTPSGQWVTVKVVQARFLDAWQVRMVLWLAGSALIIAPAGYLFARRITAPLATFAQAARRLGADPKAPPILLRGPAELGEAADAFNDMQTRLRRYVADRTAMFSAISHDLRTPLARILFKMERWPGPLGDSIAKDVAQMEEMIASVLKFIREGQFPGEHRPLDLNALLERVVDDAAEAGGVATMDAAPALTVTGDNAALRRLFANLIGNALKYAGAAEVHVRQEAAEAVVLIQDRGPGIPESELERVFEPFYRADRARNLESSGIGLGLAIARSIAREHGGDVTLKSDATGLTAIVRLPLEVSTSITPIPSAHDKARRLAAVS